MLYVARRLHMPSGEMLAQYVVEVAAGKVVAVSPFCEERAAMVLVDDILLSSSMLPESTGYKNESRRADADDGILYAYSLTGNGELLRLY